MMVTIGNSESFLNPLLSDSTNKLNKVEFYTSLTEKLRDEDTASHVCEEIGHQSTTVTAKLCDDVESSNAELAMAALQLLGVCLHSETVASAFTEANCLRAVQSVRRVVQQTTDKAICTRALWCLASKAFKASVLKDEVGPITDAIECALLTKNFQSMTVEHEGLNVLIRLLEETPKEMKTHTSRWATLVYPLIVHDAAKIRERAGVAMNLGMPLMLQKQEEVGRSLMIDLKQKDKKQSLLLEQLTKMMNNKNELYALKVWEYYVRLLGRLLHHGQLINQLLPFVEQGFKNPAPHVKCAAYRAWTVLIENFSLNLDILSDGKRVKLVMQVFKLSNAKVESVAMEKLASWWVFVRKLGPRAASYFDTVIIPLLNYCVGNLTAKAALPGSAQRTPTLSRLGMIASPATPNIPGSPMPQFRQLQLAGAQVLGRVLGSPLEDPSLPTPKFTIDGLEDDLIAGPAMFVKHSGILVSAVRECITNLQNDLQDGLLYHIWYSLVAHVKNVLEFTNKKDAAEVLSSFLTSLQHLVVSQSLPPEKLLKLLQAVLSLPSKALSSASYAIGTSTTGMMQGTPVLFLLDLLFNHRLLETSSDQERFFLLLEKLIVCGMSNQTGALSFMKSVLQLVDQAAPKIEARESIWRMWSLMVNPLLEHILKTNEVNAGDALEHDFTCMYAALQLPLLHLLSSDFSTEALKSMMRTWTELYTTFSRLAALVTNAEANICCEELCSRITTMLENNPEKLKDMVCVDTLTKVSQIIIGQIDFSGVKGAGQFSNCGLLSPGKFMTKKKPRPLGNLHSFVKLIAMVTQGLHQVADASSQDLKQTTGPTLQIAALADVDVLSSLFNHLPTTAVIAVALEKLSSAVGLFYSGSAKRPANKMYSQQVLTKLEKLWLDIVTSIQSRYQGLYDSEFLAHIAPLLEPTFLHLRRPIKNQTAIFWNATFSHSGPLTYPASLKMVLAKVKEKTPIILPGWDAKEIIHVEESQISQMSQGAESQVGLPNIAGLPSPRKAVGSFMNKVASPEVKKSPLKRGKSPSITSSARKKLGLDDMNSSDFVVITPTATRKRVLTPHQKEVLQERKVIPAMYNNLDASQDRSLMTQSSLTQDNSSIDLSQTPFSFSAANKKTAAEKPEVKKETSTEAETEENKEQKTVEADKKPASRRRSVTFAPSPAKAKTRSFKETNPPTVEETSKETVPPKEKTSVVLFGQTVVNTKTDSESANGDFEEDAVVIPETELTEMSMTKDEATPHNVLVSQTQASETASQESETILEKKSDDGKTRKARSSSAGSQSAESDSELSVRESRSHARRSPRKQPTPKKPKADGMKKLENWFSLSPKRTNTPPTVVGETQFFSPTEKEAVGAGTVSQASCVVIEETPTKLEDENKNVPKAEVEKATKNLFDKTVVPDTVIVEETQAEVPSSFGFVPDTQKSDNRLGQKPVVQLARLSAQDIKQLSPKKKNIEAASLETSSDDGVSKVTGPSETPTVVRKVRRRSNIRYSKASQERSTPISPVNMDDIIPSSQDTFALEANEAPRPVDEGEPTETNDSVFMVSQIENDLNVVEETMDVDPDETVDPRVAKAKAPMEVSAVIVDMRKDSSENTSAIENPDIIPADLSSMASSEDSQATIVGRRKRGRKKKSETLAENKDDSILGSEEVTLSENILDNSVDSSPKPANDTNRPYRRRSMPKKFKDTEVYTTPEKNKRKKEKEQKLRPAETLAECPHDESMEIKDSSASKTNEKLKKEKLKKNKESRDSVVKADEDDFKPEKTSKKERKKKKVKEDKASKTIDKDDNTVNVDSEDDDIPIKELIKKKANKAEEVPQVEDDEEGDDVPLVLLTNSTNKKKAEIQDEKLVQEVVQNQPTAAEGDADILSDIFDESSARTSTPSKPASKMKGKKANKLLGQLEIDMKTSPLHKKLRSTGPATLNRSMSSLQKRRKSPVSPFVKRKRSKSVSPSKRVLKRKLNVGKGANDSQEQIDLMKGTELSSSEGSQQISEQAIKEEPKLSPAKQSPLKNMPASPRRSPRKSREESPQKYTLSPTRRPLNQSLEMPETPTSATKHQSRASLILERSRLFATRSTSLSAKKKFTTLKPAAQDSVNEDLISASKSILKPTLVKSTDVIPDNTAGPPGDVKASPPPSKRTGSENSPSFRPVQIPRIYSPSASPSAGILKKRKLSGEVPINTDSPSPPNKQRRVSFNEAVDVCQLAGKDPSRPVNRCLDMPAKSSYTTSPLVACSSKVTSNQSKFVTSSKGESSDGEKNSSSFAVPHPVGKKKDSEPSQNSVKSTIESQLNTEDPIFPELQSCTDPIDQILPQLTSSTWMRGLGQLIRSRNIRTVGDLCTLTEYQVNNLPIRTPKVKTVRQVLEAYAAQIKLRKPKTASAETKEETRQEEDSICDTPKTPDSPSKEPLPSVEEALAMSPIKADTSMESMTDIHLDLKTADLDDASEVATETVQTDDATPSISEPTEQEIIFRDPMATPESVESLTPTLPQQKATPSDSILPAQVSQAAVSKRKVSSRGLLKEVEAISQKMTPEALSEMPASYLVAMTMHLNTMMTNVIVAQSNQYPLSQTDESQQ